jgi:bifunctional ADP-heptose synthase (sugar kinase/adenylyltransferase)
VLIKGSDYKVEDIVGYDIVTARGGKVVTLDFIPGFSTTLIEKRIREE